jgi:hypothetical protein
MFRFVRASAGSAERFASNLLTEGKVVVEAPLLRDASILDSEDWQFVDLNTTTAGRHARRNKEAAADASKAITLIESKAEALPSDVCKFDVVTNGRALHWMDVDAIAARKWLAYGPIDAIDPHRTSRPVVAMPR